MELKYKDNRYELEINYDLVDWEHPVIISGNTMHIPYCRDMSAYYSPSNGGLREFLFPYICEQMLSDTRGDINYSIPSLWLIVNSGSGVIKLAVTHNITFDGEFVADDMIGDDALKCVTRAPEKEAILDRVKYLW